jgi:hypothetical protein
VDIRQQDLGLDPGLLQIYNLRHADDASAYVDKAADLKADVMVELIPRLEKLPQLLHRDDLLSRITQHK